MTGKKRILMALNHREGDRVPTGENQLHGELASEIVGYKTLYGSGFEELKALWEGRREDVVNDSVRTLVDLPRKLEWDYVRVYAAPSKKKYTMPKMTGPYSWIDPESGREISFNPKAGNIMHSSHNRDLTIDDLPDPEDDSFTVDDSSFDILRKVVKELKDTHFIVFRAPDGTFPWDRTGMEEFLIRMITDEDFARKAIDGAVNRDLKYYEAALDAGADAIMTCADYSDNRGPIMGPETFRKFILPGLKKQAAAIHRKGGFFIKHTDGNLWAILDDLVEAGIDAWHGIQLNIGMDLAKLKSRYGDKICFFGGTNCDTYISGTPEDVRREIRDSLKGAAAGGGLVLTCSNIVPPGSKLENYMAGLEYLRAHGDYPLSL
jgi:uroporphyrinogen decarboxylase